MHNYVMAAKADRNEGALLDICDNVPDYGGDLHEYAGFYTEQALAIERALYGSLPGGTYDRLLGLMLQRKSTHFRVAHDAPEEPEDE